jgi:methyl-accepting chemotaxis protein
MKSKIWVGISGRLYALSLVVTLALVGLGWYSWVQLEGAREKAHFTEKNRVPQLLAMAELELNVTQVSLQVRHAILSRSPQELAKTLEYIGAKRKAMDELKAAFEKRLFSPEGKAHFVTVPAAFDKFWKIGEGNLALVQEGRKEEAFAYLVDVTIPARDELLKVLHEGMEIQSKGLSADINAVEDAVSMTSITIIAIALATAIALVAFSTYVAGLLRRRVQASLQVVEKVRDGDLTVEVRNNVNDEFRPLLSAVADMKNALTQVVSGVRQGADGVATASVEIAQGNSDLSGRTEQQASALEQTSASMEQLGTTSRQNADNAQLASQLANTASSVAQQGGQVVDQVVETMKAINHSSQKISDIIGTIDGIAFQTNILALNAAVEAARAGEQGRGFAVVAGEVRTLAQRSAEAAKEIKGLIGASVERVEQGSRLVDQAGSTMREIVTSVQRVSDIVGEISSASQEQNAGVSQVSQAVSQMDQATQQNAALVEESAAAAASLRQQAEQLVQAVSVFRLAAGSASSVPAAPRSAALVAANQPAARSAAPKALAGPKPQRPAAAAKPAGQPVAVKEAAGEWESF